MPDVLQKVWKRKDMSMQPYLLAFCEEKTKGFTRSVLTAVAHVGQNQTLFVTCAHAVTQLSKLFLVDEEGVTMQDQWALIHPSTPGLDLCFLYIRRGVPQNRIRINETPIGKELILSHGRNRVGETETASPFTIHTCLAKSSSLRGGIKPSQGGDGVAYEFLEKAEGAGLPGDSFHTPYRVLEMESWPGVSGSALWDTYGSIRGMVCAGDETDTRLVDGIPRLIYLPARIIAKEVKLVLKNSGFRKRVLQQ